MRKKTVAIERKQQRFLYISNKQRQTQFYESKMTNSHVFIQPIPWLL